MKEVYRKRKEMPNGLPSGKSTVHVPIEKPCAVEYTSVTNMLTDRRKHVRHAYYPQTKFTESPIGSMDIGWLLHDDSYPNGSKAIHEGGWLRKPKYPVSRSPMVKYYENIIQTGAVNVMRGAIAGAKGK